MEPNYRVWLDRGGNLGVQCLECYLVFWTGGEAPRCANCQTMFNQEVLQTERNIYNPESPFPRSQPPQLDEQGQEITV